MIKTRVYVEESEVTTKYRAQIERSIFGFKYWRDVDFMGGSYETIACMDVAKMNIKDPQLHAEALCQHIHDYCVRKAEKEDKDRKHKATRKVWSYLFPEENEK